MRKNLKQILSLLLSVTIIFSASALISPAADFEDDILDYLEYEINNGEVTITDCNTSISGDVTIPDTIEGYPVTTIGAFAFSGCKKITSIIISKNAALIVDGAFDGCADLAKITIPDSVTSIGYRAFYDTAYYNNTSNWQNGVLYIGKHLIEAKDNIVECEIKDGTLIIADYSFDGYEVSYDGAVRMLESVTIPDSVISIGNCAFRACGKLSNITLTDSVKSIGNGAFDECDNIVNVFYSGNQNSWNCLNVSIQSAFIHYNCTDSRNHYSTVKSVAPTCSADGYTSYSCPCGNVYNTDYVTASGHMYQNSDFCSICGVNINLGYEIKDGEVTITHCKKAIGNNVVIPAVIEGYPVTNIGTSAFENLKDISSVEIPEGVKTINMFAFYGCTGLTSITIPESVTSFGYYVFEGCTNLTDIYYSGSVSSWNKITMYGNDNLKNVAIHCEKESSPVDYLTYEINNNEVTIIACSTLVSGDFVIPDTIENLPVTAIGIGAFAYCSNITGITIPDSVTAIGGGSFAFCSKLTSITIPDGVTEINGGYYSMPDEYTGNIKGGSIPGAFYDCTNLQNIIIPHSVTSIGNNSFYGCASLESINIPDSVTTMGWQIFSGCKSLTSVTLSANIKTISKHTFSGCSSLESITIPDGVTSIGEYAFSRCTNLTNVTIPDSVTSIGEYAFGDCESLDNIVIPESVESIGAGAFGINVYGEDYSGYEVIVSPSTKIITIIGTKGSATEEYANTRENINFIDISEYDPSSSETTTKAPVTDEYKSDEHTTEKNKIELAPVSDSDIIVGEWSITVNAEMKTDDISDSVENANIKFFDANGKTLSKNSYVGTGCIVRVYDGAEYSEYTVIVMCDIDGNGKISPADARLILRAAVELTVLNDFQTIAGNVNNDDKITTSDARLILRKAVGLD